MTNLQTKHGLRFGTWNVHTLCQVGNPAQVGKIMDQFNLQLMGLSEVHWNQNGQLITPHRNITVIQCYAPTEDAEI
jgi:hypothetical protein